MGFLKLDEIPEEQKEKIIKYLDETPRLEATIEGKGSELQIKDLNGDIMDTLPHDKPVGEVEWQEKYASTAKKVIEYVTSQEEAEEYEEKEKDFKEKFESSLPYEYVTIVQKLSKEGGRKQTKHKKKSK